MGANDTKYVWRSPMRVLASLLLLLALAGCMSAQQGELPDPAARGGGMVGGEPGSPYAKQR